jgi:hypothetical protein
MAGVRRLFFCDPADHTRTAHTERHSGSSRVHEWNDVYEAYLAASPGRTYALDFPDGGSVELDLSDAEGTFQLHWIIVSTSEWAETETLESGSVAPISAPGPGGWVGTINWDITDFGETTSDGPFPFLAWAARSTGSWEARALSQPHLLTRLSVQP